MKLGRETPGSWPVDVWMGPVKTQSPVPLSRSPHPSQELDTRAGRIPSPFQLVDILSLFRSTTADPFIQPSFRGSFAILFSSGICIQVIDVRPFSVLLD